MFGDLRTVQKVYTGAQLVRQQLYSQSVYTIHVYTKLDSFQICHSLSTAQLELGEGLKKKKDYIFLSRVTPYVVKGWS